MKRSGFVFLLLILLLGCKNQDIRPKGNGPEYFPLKVGAYWIYDVLTTRITQLGGQTTTSVEMKVQLTDSVVISGSTTYIMQRYQRSSSSQPWTAVATWSARKDDYQAIVSEGNTPFLKLAFPLLDGKSWNANVFNTLGGNDLCTDGKFNCDNYVVQDWKKRFDGPGVSFDDTVTIIENNDNDPIVRQDVRKSIYASRVGLVSYESSILEYCTVGNCIGKQVVENGTIIKQTIKEYGGL